MASSPENYNEQVPVRKYGRPKRRRRRSLASKRNKTRAQLLRDRQNIKMRPQRRGRG